MTSSTWDDNTIQFPRLIAEIDAAGAFDMIQPDGMRVIDSIAISMDLEPSDVCELINRAAEEWDLIKDRTFNHGPSYDIWIAEPDKWEWCFDHRFTCEDDPDGKEARQSAHEHARYLRKTYPCAYVAVRPAGKAPLPVRPPLEDEPPFKDFSASWLGL
jgi:hypothetical protein